MVTVADIRERLDRHTARRHQDPEGVRWAAVAAILRDRPDGAELLFIRRAEHPEDPWSGHMGFPGGRVDADDATRPAAAVRETREEIGLDLEADGELLGRLSDLVAIGRGRPMGIVIAPYVFAVAGDPELVLNHEVDEAVWVPVAFLLDRTNRSTLEWRHGGGILLPCYRWHGRVIWGLTFGMVDELLEVIDGGESSGPGEWR